MVQILRKNRKHWVLEKVENLELKDIKYRKMWDEKKRKLRALNIENGKHGCSKINIPLEMGAARPNKLLTLLTQLSLIALLLPLILLTLLTLLTLHTLHTLVTLRTLLSLVTLLTVLTLLTLFTQHTPLQLLATV